MLLPKISIIIPAYNEEKFLPGCLDSIHQLNYPKKSLEVIVVDNGSTDRTREIARSFGVMVVRDDSRNVSGLRNIGASMAKGEILAFVDADCIVATDWLQAASRYFDDESIVGWGGPPVPPPDASWVQETWFLMLAHKEQVKKVDWLGTVDFFVRRALFMETGQFEETLITCEDVDFCYRIGQKGDIISDSSIKIMHMREADTLVDFFRKEVWRGMDNVHGVLKHGFSLKELPSLLLPLYFLLLLPLSAILIVSLGAVAGIILVLFFLLFPAILVIIKKRAWGESPMTIMRLICLIEVYFFARTVALFKKNKKR